MTSVSTGAKWFPDKKGFLTGVLFLGDAKMLSGPDPSHRQGEIRRDTMRTRITMVLMTLLVATFGVGCASPPTEEADAAKARLEGLGPEAR
ncbi:MAG: hypothetical protein Q8L86_11340 [Vicinamibacterales bacterium]|nr:hypothetical protein [Vicinamibacterales bacterium]